MLMPEFRKGSEFTIGVELEFQLVDDVSMNLSPCAPLLIDKCKKRGLKRIKKEFIQAMIEVTTGVCPSITDVECDLIHRIKTLQQTAKEMGVLINPTSLHPFSDPYSQPLTDDIRYREILFDLQIVGQHLITQGFHIHIGVKDGDTAIKVADNIRAYLPLFLSLSASSPYFCGRDTGFQSYRASLFEAVPYSGVPPELKDWAYFKGIVKMLMEADIISDVRDIWWDVRPHPYFGTVEIRICDIPPRFKEIISITAFAQALVHFIVKNQNTLPVPPHRLIIVNNKWHAARYGLEGYFVDVYKSEKMTQREAALRLIDALTPSYKALGTTQYIDGIYDIIKKGSGSKRQRGLIKKGYGFQDVILAIIREFWM